MRGLRGRAASTAVLAGALAVASLVTWAGIATGATGGGYQTSQMDCQPYSSDWATPQGLQYPGCHNTALNVESGGTTNGVANPNNTRYAEVGNNQAPNDPNSVGTNTPYSIGEPGYTGSPHGGCVAANTGGTGGGAAPYGETPVPGNQTGNTQYSNYGCGNNTAGTGFAINYDYYQYYCPVVAKLGKPCEDTSYGTTTGSLDHGTAVAYKPIVANGLLVYFAEDDNTDNGEHDGVGPYNNAAGYPNDSGAASGSSDGGAITASVTPQSATRTPSLTHPEGLANLSTGFCADGICAEVTTQQQAVAQGCGAPSTYVARGGKNGTAHTAKRSQAPCAAGTPKSANVYNYAAQNPSLTQSQNCNGGGAYGGSSPGSTTDASNCGPGGMNALRSSEPATEYANPGVQVFADPDPNRSPAAPAPFWPTPGVYAGTCGVTAGSPALPTAAAINKTPVGNGAGQVAVSTGC